jgi:hypothetical protein
MKSAFGEWFEAQHGKRVNELPDSSDDQLRSLIKLCEAAGRELAYRKLWDRQRTSALYAWKARERTPDA